jgi:TRAP-type mannitol/chloroaromatic compound transport system permease small subunit
MRARLKAAAAFIDRANRGLGRVLGWTVILLVLVQFMLVLTSSVFHVGSIKFQESLLYLNSVMFLGGAGYVLLVDGHVRVDLNYQGASKRYQAKVNFWGTIFFLWPVCGLILWYGLPLAIDSWAQLETSQETSGLPLFFLMKSFIPLFGLTLAAQGVSLVSASLDVLKPAPSPKVEV